MITVEKAKALVKEFEDNRKNEIAQRVKNFCDTVVSPAIEENAKVGKHLRGIGRTQTSGLGLLHLWHQAYRNSLVKMRSEETPTSFFFASPPTFLGGENFKKIAICTNFRANLCIKLLLDISRIPCYNIYRNKGKR